MAALLSPFNLKLLPHRGQAGVAIGLHAEYSSRNTHAFWIVPFVSGVKRCFQVSRIVVEAASQQKRDGLMGSVH